MPRQAYIVDAVRTPTGRKKGGLAAIHAADLGAHVINALMQRTGVDPNAIEDVVFGACDQIGPLAGDVARTCWLAAGLPDHVPGTTVDRQCGSAQQAVHFAAMGIMSGTQDLVVAGGVQTMNAIPISASMLAGRAYGFDEPFGGSTGWVSRYGAGEVSQFNGAASGQTIYHLHFHIIPRWTGQPLGRHAGGGMADPAELAELAKAIAAEIA